MASCKTCRYFRPDSSGDGSCVKKPPIIFAADGSKPVSGFPPTRSIWWCGEYKPKLKIAD